MTYNPTDAIV